MAAILVVTGRPDPAAGPVTVEIRNSLGSDQVSERVVVFLDARRVGVLEVDERSPKARLRVTLSAAGKHDYRLEANRRLKGQAPLRKSTTGSVAVGENERLAVYSSEEGDTHLLPDD